MNNQCNTKMYETSIGILRIGLFLILSLLLLNETVCQSKAGDSEREKIPSPKSAINLEKIPYKIVYETFRKTNGRENWELYLINADGSNPVNLTKTPDIDEMYPHASPDGGKVCFVADEIIDSNNIRNIYYMNIDGTGRVKVADNARQPCWSPDGKTIAYLPGEFCRYTIKDFATKGLIFYDLQTRKHKEHRNKNLYHLYNICWSPDGQWFLATVHGGMDFEHAILTFKIDGTEIYDLTKFGVTGCRAEFDPTGKKITWGLTDWDLCTADIDLVSGEPLVTNVRKVVKCHKEYEVYHTDFSPDGKYLTFSSGPEAVEMVGGKAPGWNICITDLTGKWVVITDDGNHNKEPDWIPLRTSNR